MMRAFFVCAILLGACSAFGAEAQRPNVLILHVHDIGQYLHCYGVKGVISPNLDRLAAGGVRFARSFSTAPGCSPSRASIFTGRYPHSNGVMGLTHGQFGWDLNKDEVHLAQYLLDAGYQTAAIGQVHETRSPHERVGFERSSNKKPTPQAIEWLTEFSTTPERPFFMSVGYFTPHRLVAGRSGKNPVFAFTSEGLTRHPDPDIDIPGYLLDTPETRRELTDLQVAVNEVDTEIGKVLEALQRLNLEQNTLVIFTTDHGIAMPRAKCTLYDPGIEVACILRYPGRKGWHGGIVKDEMISNVDYLPTILELVGISVPEKVQGKSFANLLDGKAYTPRSEIFAEQTYHNYYDPRRAIRTERYKLILNYSTAPSFMDCSQDWRPAADTAVQSTAIAPPMEFYDLVEDKWELKNLANDAKYEDIRHDLHRRLVRSLTETDDPILKGAVTPPRHREIQEMP